MKTIFIVSLVLTIIGGINWGLYGLAGIDLVAALFGFDTMLSNIVYCAVGVAAVTLALVSANVIIPSDTKVVKRSRRAHA